MVLGEITSNAKVDIQKVVRDTIKEIGYDNSSVGFDYNTCSVQSAIEQQTSEIADSVHTGKKDEELGAGDQVRKDYVTGQVSLKMSISIIASSVKASKYAWPMMIGHAL